MIIRSSRERLTSKELKDYLKAWDSSEEKKRLESYYKYYTSENEMLADKVKDRAERRKTPNNYIPTAYYKTVVDGMAGYLFQNIEYSGDEKIIEVLNKNNNEIKDMVAGNNSLLYNRGIELLYTTGDEANTDIRFTYIDPRGVILIYTDDIEPVLFCAIRVYGYNMEGYEFRFDVIYADQWEFYGMRKGVNGSTSQIEKLDKDKKLFFSSVPVVVYNAEIVTDRSPFDQILGYIVALDWIVSGNANEIDRLVDALLVIGKNLKQEDLDKMPEWKALQGIKKDERAEYLTKDMSPSFREYVSKLLIQEIHKHSHIVDWYSPDNGMSGAASGKALKTRLFDMDMYSKKIEKVYRIGAEQRIKLINEIFAIKKIATEEVKIIFNRTMPSDMEEKLVSLNQATFLSNQTKVEEVGLNWEDEKERLAEESKIRQSLMGDIDPDEDVLPFVVAE